MAERLLYMGSDEAFAKSLSKSNLFDVEVVSSAYLASKIIYKSGIIYAIICDDTIKGITPYDFYKEIFSTIYFRGIPFIIVQTNKLTLDEKQIALKEKIDDIYTKPVSLEDLERRLQFVKKWKTKKLAFKKMTKEKKDLTVPFMKRTFDIVFAFFILLILSPLFLLIIILLKLESKGPVFYSSKRVGMGYKIFNFYKFRSMYVDADKRLKELSHLNQYNDDVTDKKEIEKNKKETKNVFTEETVLVGDEETISETEFILSQRNKKEQAFVKIKNDPRITKVGRFIRKTSIDELPQLVNVLKGDMSIVGNRPIPLYEAEVLTSDEYSTRFMAPSGITGLWQVTKRGKADMSNEERKQLDNTYAENYSFWGDIKLLLKTAKALLQTEDV